MNTNLEFSSGRVPRRRQLHVAALAAWLCAGLLITQPGGAQETAENAPAAKVGTTVPLPAGHGPMQMTISMAPAPGSAAPSAAPGGPLHGPNCNGAVRGESAVAVSLGKSMLVPIDEPVRNRTLGNPAVAQATMVSPQTLYIVGQSIGTTNMIIQGRSGACQIIDVVVNADSGGLQASLAQLLPAEHDIRVSTAADNLVLAGHVSTAQAAQQAVAIATVYSANGAASGAGKAGGVLNMLTVDSPQQVMLEVKVAEVDKTLIDQLGSAVNIQGGFGSWTGGLVSSLLAGVSSTFSASKSNKLPFQVSVDAQKTDNLVKILAEPNLVTISGQEATFLAGGEVFMPVPQSSGSGATAITLQEEEFGVGLKFTPTVLGNGRINLRVAPEVSELSPTGVTLSATNVSGTSILPLITTRRASTTVQMNDGESFAIGGLISNNVTGALKAIPGIGEVPILGALFRSTSFQQDRSELVFIITAHLVKPQPPSNYQMPTDSFTQPIEADVYATGNMEGRGAAHKGGAAAASPAPAAQAPQAPGSPATATPAAATLAPPSTPPAGPAPISAISPGAATRRADTQVAAADEQDARAAGIEREAARIAADRAREQLATTSPSNHATDQ